MTELRAADLRFTPDEAAAFLNEATSLNLSAQDSTALETRTEGWIAGLQLAEVAKPAPQGNEALIRIHATPVNFGDLIARNFKNVTPCKFNMPIFSWLPARMAFGWRKPKNNVLGSEFAGEVAAVGAPTIIRLKLKRMRRHSVSRSVRRPADQPNRPLNRPPIHLPRQTPSPSPRRLPSRQQLNLNRRQHRLPMRLRTTSRSIEPRSPSP